ncbi:MAG: hypothetical protein A4S09_09360 [Proteobacteria bacterium SG_bin7]|nr:MAG: hypothetical protein A4S09_09360 [Proteobacteria bacterium SG_bin7]
MAHMNPLLKSIIELRHRLEAGESLRSSFPNCLCTDDTQWNSLLKRWFMALEHGTPTDKIVKGVNSPYRRIFLELLSAGFSGAPIYQNLLEIEIEVISACEIELEQKLRKLPFHSMLPVLFLMFPAFLIILLGPVLIHLLKELSQ